MPATKKQVNINLVQKEIVSENFSEQLLSWALTYGRYIIIITQIIVLSVFFMRFKLDRDHTDLKESVTQKQAIIESISDLETEIRKTQDRLANIRKITTGQDNITKVLRYLQENTPADTVFSSLSLNENEITFNATSLNLRSFSYLLQRLQQENKFSEVTLNDISRRTDGKVEFKIGAKINFKAFT